MNKHTLKRDLLPVLRLNRVIPVVTMLDAAHAVPLARALMAGGIRVLEITLRSPQGMPAIKAIAEQVPDIIIGVGTVLHPDEWWAAREAGATFAVSPGLTPALMEAAQSHEIPLLPGVMTPSDVMCAREAGFRQVKLFPAAQAGGIGMLKALLGPFPDMLFCPTGGLTQETAAQYLACQNVVCVGGGWLTPKETLKAGEWTRVTALARLTARLD